MTYSQLNQTYTPKESPSTSSIKLQQTAVFMAPNYTANVPPQSSAVVANYRPFTEKYKYNTLLHRPPSEPIGVYNSSGYFQVTQAYVKDCTETKTRVCDPPFNLPFETS